MFKPENAVTECVSILVVPSNENGKVQRVKLQHHFDFGSVDGLTDAIEEFRGNSITVNAEGKFVQNDAALLKLWRSPEVKVRLVGYDGYDPEQHVDGGAEDRLPRERRLSESCGAGDSERHQRDRAEGGGNHRPFARVGVVFRVIIRHDAKHRTQEAERDLHALQGAAPLLRNLPGLPVQSPAGVQRP